MTALFLALLGIASDETADSEHAEERPTVVRQTGYLDLGFFDAQGDGVAYDRDVGNAYLGVGDDGRYRDAPWVFYGDPWANMVNSQGDSADLGLDRTNIDRYDPIASGGRPTFLVNRYHHALMVDKGDALGLRVRVNLEPRAGHLGRIGDVIELDTAYLMWSPFSEHDVTFYAGRIDSSFGAEYRRRHAPVRYGITPSLVARYLVGRQTGVRVRGTYRRWLGYSLAVTNGGTVDERFGHLSDDLDSNGVPTVTARLGAVMRRPVSLEVGISGQVGAQDSQPDPAQIGWQLGVDGRLDADAWTVIVEGVLVEPPSLDQVGVQRDHLQARGGYVEVAYRFVPSFGAYGRFDWRDAELRSGPNLYVSDVVRWTGGLHLDLDHDVMLKAEYLHIDELGVNERCPTPEPCHRTEIHDDVFTTSVVFRYRTRRRPL